MRRTKKQMAMQAATAIAMKKAGKKPNKYAEGGKTSAVSAIQAGQASAQQEIAKEEEQENLMKGRTFIPRMSQTDRQKLMDLAKSAMEKSKERRIERITGKLIDLGVDPEVKEPEVEEPEVEKPEMEEPVDAPVDESAPDATSPGDEELFAKYGMKILKKYSKKKNRRR